MMQSGYRKAMDALYLACIVIAGISITVMSVVVPWGVFARYVLNAAAAWPEPLAVLLMILFTFFGGAACYRAGIHISVELFVAILPRPLKRFAAWIEEGLMAVLAGFMVYWGFGLVSTTWHQAVAEFPWISTGVTYLPIPLGGIVTLLFIFERAALGPPPKGSMVYREPIESN